MVLATLGVFVISFDALLVRLAGVDAATVSFYRGLFMGISMLFVWYKLSKRPLKCVKKSERKLFFLIVTLSALSTSLFVFSINYTAAANTVVFLATASFFAAIFTYFLIKERIEKSTILAIIISFVGVAIVFGNSFGIGSNWMGDLMGIALAIVMGLQLTLLRKYPHFPHMLIISLSGFVVAFVMFFISQNLLNRFSHVCKN